LGSDPVDMCGDGTGGLYLMTDIGTFTDPNLNASTDLSTSVVQLEFDPQTGARTATDILARTTDETQVIACDGVAPEAGGLVYVPEFFNVDFPATPCSRDSREALTAVSKSTGPPVVIVADIAAAAGYGECDDFDPTADLEVGRAAPGSSDGVLLVSFVTRGGFADLGSNLLVRGTVAVALPAQSNTNACTVLGLVSLEFLDPMTF